MSNDIVCQGLTLTTPYTLETLKSFDAFIKSGKGVITQEIIDTLAKQLNVKVASFNEHHIVDPENGHIVFKLDTLEEVWDTLYCAAEAELEEENEQGVELWYDSTRIAYDCPFEAAEAEFQIQILKEDSNYKEYLDLLRIACEKYNQYTLTGLQSRMGLAECYLYGWGVLIDQPKALQMFRNLAIQALNLIQIRED
jgi:hypothetical protein